MWLKRLPLEKAKRYRHVNGGYHCLVFHAIPSWRVHFKCALLCRSLFLLALVRDYVKFIQVKLLFFFFGFPHIDLKRSYEFSLYVPVSVSPCYSRISVACVYRKDLWKFMTVDEIYFPVFDIYWDTLVSSSEPCEAVCNCGGVSSMTMDLDVAQICMVYFGLLDSVALCTPGFPMADYVDLKLVVNLLPLCLIAGFWRGVHVVVHPIILSHVCLWLIWWNYYMILSK